MSKDVLVRPAEVADVTDVARLLTELNLQVGAGGYPAPQEFEPGLATVTPDQLQRRAIAMRNLETVFVAEVGARLRPRKPAPHPLPGPGRALRGNNPGLRPA